MPKGLQGLEGPKGCSVALTGNCLPDGKRKLISNAQRGYKGLKGQKAAGCPDGSAGLISNAQKG
ncbi:MAG: hypothetical protein IIW75_00415 [Bacteroidaceae bacterium]|nr:hypothetical protein [Bacteroidaceae bacterium]